MGLRHVAVATALALAGATLVAAPAQARPEGDRMARDGDHFPTSVSTTVPAGGTSMITTPTLGKDIKALTVTVKAKNPTPLQSADFDAFINSIGSLSKSKRLLVCTMMYQTLLTPDAAYEEDYEVEVFTASLAGATLLACLQMAGLLAANNRPSDHARSSAAAKKCGQVRPSLPATVKKVNGGYSLKASGTTKKAKRPKLKVTCKASGNKVKYTIRPRKRGVPLRKVVGRKLMVGIKSPADAQTSVPVRVTFARP